MKSKFYSLFIAGLLTAFFAACSSDNTTSVSLIEEEPVESSSSIDVSEMPLPSEPSSSSISNPVVNDPIVNEPSSSSITQITQPQSYTYYGAELTGREHFTYGKFEAKMKMLAFPGTVSSMFTYYDESYLLKGNPWNEIDIEILGKDATKWQSNLITREADAGSSSNPKQYSEKIHEISDVTQNFHVYAIIWTPEYIAWEIDGVEVRRNTVGDAHTTVHDQVAFMTQTQSLRFNVWASNTPSWSGNFTGEELANGPIAQEIDYVKVYRYNQSTKNFEELWTDEFEGNTLNNTHWTTGNWEMQKVKYRPQNVVVENGVCKLIMDRE